MLFYTKLKKHSHVLPATTTSCRKSDPKMAQSHNMAHLTWPNYKFNKYENFLV